MMLAGEWHKAGVTFWHRAGISDVEKTGEWGDDRIY